MERRRGDYSFDGFCFVLTLSSSIREGSQGAADAARVGTGEAGKQVVHQEC